MAKSNFSSANPMGTPAPNFSLKGEPRSVCRDLTDKIHQLLQHQRHAVRRATFMGMSNEEATEMEARIDRIRELVDQLNAQLT